MTTENPIPAPVPPASQPLSPSEERTWSVLAHLTVLLNLVTGFAGPIAALIIYIVYKDRSRRVAYDALQSMIFQLIWWHGAGLLVGSLIGITWAVVGALSAIVIGVFLIPVAVVISLVALLLLLMPVASLVYGVIGAIEVNQGHDFKYWLIGDWVRSTLTGQ